MNVDLLHTCLGWAWRTSLAALPLALAALLLWRLIPTRWRWVLPALFFLRLALPQVPETSWSWRKIELPAHLAPTAQVSPASEAAAPAASTTVVAAALASRDWPTLLAYGWAAGFVGIMGWLAVCHWRLQRVIAFGRGQTDEALQQHSDWAAARMALSQRVPVRIVPGWTTLAISGWWRPLLLAPADLHERFTPAQIRGMLLHEMAHVRRRDVLWTWLALGLCALHWFNPFAWLALRRFHADRELICDAAALEALAPTARRDYGEALLLCLRSPAIGTSPALAPFFRRFPELKQRLQNIMKPTHPSLTGRIFAGLILPSIVAISFTAATAAEREGEKPKSAEGARDGERKPEGARDGEQKRDGTPDGVKPKARDEDGQPRKPGARRDGDSGKTGPRDGEARKEGARDGERKRTGARDGEARKEGARDGEARKEGARDGERKREGTRDGEARKEGARDGEARKTGPRDGDAKPAGPRDGEGKAAGARDGDAKPKAE